jgi:hypothetical protein
MEMTSSQTFTPLGGKEKKYFGRDCASVLSTCNWHTYCYWWFHSTLAMYFLSYCSTTALLNHHLYITHILTHMSNFAISITEIQVCFKVLCTNYIVFTYILLSLTDYLQTFQIRLILLATICCKPMLHLNWNLAGLNNTLFQWLNSFQECLLMVTIQKSHGQNENFFPFFG